MVDILCGVLSGGNWGPRVDGLMLPSKRAHSDDERAVGIGHFFGALRIDGFREPSDFKASLDEWVGVMRQATPIAPDTPVLVPGDPEWAAAAAREHGVPVKLAVLADLRDIAHQAGIAPPFDEARVDLSSARRVVVDSA
jgi:L-2-hydroxycarboxylate dehydrogenase (NAD+)